MGIDRGQSAPAQGAFASEITPLIREDEARAYDLLRQRLDLRGDSYYAEWRFGAERQLDLLLAFHRASISKLTLKARVLDERGPFADVKSRAWAVARSFLLRWLDGDGELGASVSTVWLEFDDVQQSGSAAPSLSACLVTGYGPRYLPTPSVDRRADAERLLQVYRALSPEGPCAASEAALSLCESALPPLGRVIHLSVMTAREPAAVKLYVVMPRAELSHYLRAVGWRGAQDAVNRVLDDLVPESSCGPSVYFDLNLSNMASPETASLGIALGQQLLVHSGEASRRALLDRLVTAGQLTLGHAEQLMAWPSAQAGGLGLGQPDRAPRYLDLKLVIDALGRLQTKAYLGFGGDFGAFGPFGPRAQLADAEPGSARPSSSDMRACAS